MNSRRGEEILNEILRISRLPEGMEREKALIHAGSIAALELVKRRQGEAPGLPFPSWELWEFMDWVEKEKLRMEGDFHTAWELYQKRREWDAGERV